MATNIIISDDENLKNYQLQKLIGQGEFCDVYKAVNLKTGHVVALKQLRMREMINGQSRLDCISEISVLAKLKHPNIIRYLESFYAYNELYVSLEYADAGDLSKMLLYLRKKNEFLTERAIKNFYKQICFGLEYMHLNKIIHRDIKPANILINRDRTVKLGDFGFSRFLSSVTGNIASTIVGTPYYMSPERLNGQNYSFPSDLWSMGCVLYELITLSPPFYEEKLSYNDLLKKILCLKYVPVDPETYSQELTTIINGCLLIDPRKRLNIEQVKQLILANANNHNNDQQPQTIDNQIDTKSNDDHLDQHHQQEQQQQTIQTDPSTNQQNSRSSLRSFRNVYKNIKNMF